MISETIETYSKKHFDYNDHIAIFLHTSAVYLDVSERQTIPRMVELVMPAHQHTEV